MEISGLINKLDKKLGWSFLGFLLAAIFGLLSVYTEFLKHSSPQLQFEILNNSPVLDVREKLPDLDVLYRSQEISRSGKTLSVLLVRAVNRGSDDILKNYFDSKSPVGLDLHNGTLIKANVSDASNEYLKETSEIISDDSKLSFNPLIIEVDQWFIIKLLVLHNIDNKPELTSRGKIASQYDIDVLTSIPSRDAEGFWYKSFSGDLWVQLTRLPTYFLAFVVILIVIIIPASATIDLLNEHKRKKIVQRFKHKTKLKLNDDDEFIFQGFVKHGFTYLQALRQCASDPEKLDEDIKSFVNNHRTSNYYESYSETAALNAAPPMPSDVYLYSGFIDAGKMINSNFVVKQNGNWIVAPNKLQLTEALIGHIEMIY